MRIVSLALAALALALPGRPAAADDDYTLQFDPFKNGFEGWQRTGSDKAFTLNQQEGTLTIKGQGGKDAPRLVWTKSTWDRGELRLQAKKGCRKLRLLVQPMPDGKPVVLELPSSAMKPANWTDVALRLLPAKAVLVVSGADGAESEVASAEVPAGVSCRFGIEAPSGSDLVATGVKIRRVYEDDPQICEEGFESLFDGKSLGSCVPMRPEDGTAFSVEKGLLVGQIRSEDAAYLVLGGHRAFGPYELRFRALWCTTFLEVRAV